MDAPRPGGLSLSIRAHLRALRRDTQGSVHILETVLVGVMVVGAVVAVATMNVPVSQTEGFKSSQEQLVQDALNTLAAQPSHDNSEVIFDTLLEEYVMKAVADRPGPLMDYLNRSLPAGSQYNVFLDTGFGRPIPILEGGSPPGESLAGARTFVPKMSYVFMVPEFQRYHGDFHMNVLAIPMHNSILQKDEGHPIELSVTFTNEDGKSQTQRVFAETALRYNDPGNRSWASTSVYAEGPDGKPTYYIDASSTTLSNLMELNLEGVLHSVTDDVYNITVPFVVEETANHPIPRGAQITVEYPRGWVFEESQQKWIEQELEDWTDFEWDGSDNGWVINARLKDPLRNDKVYFNLTGMYVMLMDSAYPYFHPVHAWMGGGTQGKATVLVDTPQDLDVGGFRRDLSISLAKPMISDIGATWGMNFANMGEELGGDVTIEQIELKQPQQIPLMASVAHISGWTEGQWFTGDTGGHYIWRPTGSSQVKAGDAAWLAMHVVGGPTRDNHYRNHDYQDLLFHFSPNNTTGGGGGDWSYTQRAHNMAGEYVYRQMVPPYEPELLWMDEWPGWPDQASSYWFGAEARQQNRVNVGNASYDVGTSALLAQTFGDYQGSHVFSQIEISDLYGEPQRNFEVGERVRINNDFSALFAELGILDTGASSASVSDIKIKSSVYTPEKAWTGDPTKVFEAKASVDLTMGSFRWIFPTDLMDNGIDDLVLVTTDGLVYGIDGLTGARLWTYDTGKTVRHGVLSDVTGDGNQELVLTDSNQRLIAVDLDMDTHYQERTLWDVGILSGSELLQGVPPHTVRALVDLTGGDGILGEPMLGLALSANQGASWVTLVNVDKNANGDWDVTRSATHTVPNHLLNDNRITDLVHVKGDGKNGSPEDHLAFGAMDKTVTLLSIPDLQPQWRTLLPHTPAALAASDLNGDGHEDLLVNTGPSSGMLGEPAGDHIYVLPGRTGHLGPTARTWDATQITSGINAWDSATMPDGTLIVTTHDTSASYQSRILTDSTGLIAPKYDYARLGDCLNPLTNRAFGGLHTDLDGTVYAGTLTGHIYQAVETCEDGSVVFEFFDEHPGIAIPKLHAKNAAQGSGKLWTMDPWGAIYERDGGGSWQQLTEACVALFSCDPTPSSHFDSHYTKWHVHTDEQGNPERFFALLRLTDGDIFASYAPGEGWTNHDLDPSVNVSDFTLTKTGTALLVGDKDGVPYGWSLNDPASTLNDDRFFHGNTTGGITTTALGVAVDDDDTGWALDADGQAWRRSDSGFWVPYVTQGFDGPWGHAMLAQDADGTLWAFTDDLRHIPLATHVDQGTVRPHIQHDARSLWDLGHTQLRIDSTEGHLGNGNLLDKSLTDVRWHFRYAGGGDWILMDRPDLAKAPGLHAIQHVADLECGTNDCSGIQFKATLHTRTMEDLLDGSIHQDPGAAPHLLEADIYQTIAGTGIGQNVASLDPSPGGAARTNTIHSSASGGFTLDSEPPRWAYRGIANEQSPLFQDGEMERRFAVSTGPMHSSSDGPGVAISERGDTAYLDYLNQWGGGLVQMWVLDGDTGAPIAPSNGEFQRDLGWNFVDQVITGDFTGDGIENAAFLGNFDDETDDGTTQYRVVYFWDTENDEFHHIDTEADQIVTAAAHTGAVKGRQTIAFAAPAIISNESYSGSDSDNLVHSWFGPTPDGQPPEPHWATKPVESQGFSAFTYQIPRNALFGTSLVVSEMTFDLSLDGTTVTQTARLLDWFDILPPGRGQSVPPVYTVEVVAWFDEGYGQVERRPTDDGGSGGGGSGIQILPDINAEG